ncbi:MAG: hypothetical protein GC202_07840 [Alphaproteobacteria bacterium]|nr:hypothetical protein [Alphaproteobacteria bacterium]
MDFEIVVVTPVPFEAPRTRILIEATPGLGAAHAYNAAAAAARGEILVHVTDRKRFRPGWLEAALATLHARDRGGPPFVACLPMHDPDYGDAFVGTAMGWLYPWFFAAHRRLIDRVGPYCDTDFKSSFLDVDLGFRVWTAGGRCEIVQGGAWYEHAPDLARVRAGTSHAGADFSRLCARWLARFGENLMDATAPVQPWNVCIDVPSVFFAHFVRNGAIIEIGRDWQRFGPFLRTAARLLFKEGIQPPGSVLADPAHIPDWVIAIDSARRRSVGSA